MRFVICFYPVSCFSNVCVMVNVTHTHNKEGKHLKTFTLILV